MSYNDELLRVAGHVVMFERPGAEDIRVVYEREFAPVIPDRDDKVSLFGDEFLVGRIKHSIEEHEIDGVLFHYIRIHLLDSEQ